MKLNRAAPRIPAAWRPYTLYAVSKIAPGLMLFAAVPIWTRTFGPEQYGLYSMCWVATLFSSAFFTGWLSQAVLRHAGDRDFDLDAIPRWVIPTCAAISALPVIVIVWTESIGHKSADSVGLVLAGALFAGLNSYYAVTLTRSQRYDHVGRYAAAEMSRIGVAIGLSFAGTFILGWQGSVSIIAAYCVGTAVGIAIILQGFREPETVILRTPLALKTFWSFGWPMTLWLTVSSMLLYSDRLIIGILLNAEAVGRYGAISDLIVRGVGMLMFPFTMRAHPALMRRWNSGDRPGALALARRYTKFVVISGGVCVAFGSLVGSRILQPLLGVDIGSPLIVPALLGGAALWQVGQMSHKPLEMRNQTKTMLLIISTITALSVAANVILIPRIGLVAPALVFFAGSACYVMVTSYLFTQVEVSIADEAGESQSHSLSG
jgi:O-antigen/teichoic acid export membrane protein